MTPLPPELEALMPEPVYAVNNVEKRYFTPDQVREAIKAATERERERAAAVCDKLSEDYRDAYKGRTEPIDRGALYNPHTDGLSDGAGECADAIREAK